HRVADRDGFRLRPARRGDKPGYHVVPNFAGWVSTLLGSKGLFKKVAYDAQRVSCAERSPGPRARPLHELSSADDIQTSPVGSPRVSDPPKDPTHVTTVLGCQLVKAA